MRTQPFLMLLTGCLSVAGCASSPWHEDLMTPQQIAAADCPSLAMEQKRTEENATHLKEAASGSTGGVVLLSLLDAVAQSQGASNTGGAAARQAAEEGETNAAQARILEQKIMLIEKLRARRSCV